MTTPSSPLSQGARDNFDTGRLSWVMGEIREALTRSKTALHEAVAQDAEAQSTTLRHAKTYLHQAHGALQIVDVDGVAIVTETVEDLLVRVDSGQLGLTHDLAQTISNGYQAVLEYLEELLSGAAHQPVRLFPYYRALLEARGEQKIHPADLFFPDLSLRPQLPLAEPAAALQPRDYTSLRQRFEKALLPFLKKTELSAQPANAAAMRDLIGEIERKQSNQQFRGFWWVMYGFAETVAAGGIRNEIYVKQLFGLINLQIRRLSQGSSSIEERLLRDALFLIAQAEIPSPRAQQIRRAYRLDGMVPEDYEEKRYGQIDADALAAAKARLAQAKNIWNRIAAGDITASDSFEREMYAVAEAGSRLNPPSIAKLLRDLSGIARRAAHASSDDGVGLEMATSLLFVENSLNQLGRLTDNFAERAEAVAARLATIVSGQQPADSVQWLDDMSRQAQQRQSMTAVAGEMQTSLRQVEKMLDEFFKDPSQRTALDQLDLVLHQIEGALAILDQDDAVRTVQHTRAAVQRFAASESVGGREQQEFKQVAQNVGALSFFIESLQLNSERAIKRFSFDEERGVFQANLLEKNTAPNPIPDETAFAVPAMDDGNSPHADASFSKADAELAYQHRQPAEPTTPPTSEPDNPVPQKEPEESREQSRQDAGLVDDVHADERARAGIAIPQCPDFASSGDASAEIISATVPNHAASEPLPPATAPASDEAVDAELLEIFLLEAEEVLACVKQTIPESRNAPDSQEHLTTLRRSFHTLKGSGRMVGLTAFGAAAWSIEQVLNIRLSESRGGDADLYALLDQAAEILGVWVADLQEQGKSAHTPHALVNAAERVKKGETFLFAADEVPQTIEVASAPEETLTDENNAGDDVRENIGEAAIVEEVEFSIEPASEPTVPEAAIPAPSDTTTVAVAEQAAVAEVENALDQAAVELLEKLPPVLSEAQDIGLPDVAPTIFQIRESLPPIRGDNENAGFAEPAEPAPSAISPSNVIEFPGMTAPQAMSNDNTKRIGDLDISVPLYNIYVAETDELVRLLALDMAEWRHEPERQVNIQSVHAAHSLAGSSATVGFVSLHEVAHALEMILQFLVKKPVQLEVHEFDTLQQTVERLKLMLHKFALGEMPVHPPEYVRLLTSMRQDLAKRSESSTESSTPASKWGDAAFEPNLETAPQAVSEAGETMPPVSAPAPDLATLIRVASVTGQVFSDGNHAALEPTLTFTDDLDADLLPVFLEEGRDMLPQMGQALRSWQEQPGNADLPQSILRILHTLKGSARMAGAMGLGQQLHGMETRTEIIMRLGNPSPQAFEDLLIRYDQGLQSFEGLHNSGAGRAAAVINPGTEQAEATQGAATAAAASAAPLGLSPLTSLQTGKRAPVHPQDAKLSAPAPLVRVRADILDRLVNQAGEVSISRSKLETEVGTLRQSLSELTENVGRLRGQLREIEMQAETQITSRMAQSGEREFDPLEFDRFTRLQELTRMMAESVNDVGSVHQNLSRTLESATADLTVQARLTRELQQDLMRVRMVPFASVSERLYRVTRQAAKEVDKRINLDIRGTAVEMDRGVLERMIGPFEHLLRNAIVHGIESREARRAAGKNETGELLVEVRQEGNEVVIQFSDDGQGLNIGRIRDKAARLGLLADDSHLPDEEVTDLIFHPGFSTAEEVTELAGRGIGMDVVQSEAAALGGRVATLSEPGQGARFTIHLPLTLAVTQVVLLSSGGKIYAVPSVVVEQVQQLKGNALATAYNDGGVMWQGQHVPIHYLPALLGDTAASPVAQQYSALMILKSGNERVALHVDEIVGNREVVIKNIGPQLARMVGIAGATVLGSGDIVLILNPVPLAQRIAQENMHSPRLIPSDAPASMGAVAEMADPQRTQANIGAVQGLRTQKIVMVVDDSLTVRRVTQRLLAREGYHVVLAKDGVDALQQLQSVTPDVMLVDIEMPRMDGFDLTRNVRDDERTRHVPIIMITSRTADKHRNYAMEIGVNEYLGKPYQEEQLLGLITGFVSHEVRLT